MKLALQLSCAIFNLEQDIHLGTCLHWLHWYAFDTITSIITFSVNLGFMEHEIGIDHMIESIENRLKYNSVIGQALYVRTYVPTQIYLFGNQYLRLIHRKLYPRASPPSTRPLYGS